jgi:hypothetical protein
MGDLEMKRLKCKCGHEIMHVDFGVCDDCQHNGVWTEPVGIYTYPETTEDSRTEAEDNYECELGCTYNAGCHIYTCADCGNMVDRLPLMED